MPDGILFDDDGFMYDPCWACRYWSGIGCDLPDDLVCPDSDPNEDSF